MSTILETVTLSKNFGGLHAVSDVDFRIEVGEIVGIIGPNGAGKTTVFNLLTGFLVPTKGDIVFKGENIVKKKPNQIVNRGMTRTFQIVRPFQQMTVLENVLVPFQTPKNRKITKSLMENQRRAAKILDQVGLGHREFAPARPYYDNLFSLDLRSHGHPLFLTGKVWIVSLSL